MAIISSTQQRAAGSSARRAEVAYHFGGCARAKKNLLEVEVVFLGKKQKKTIGAGSTNSCGRRLGPAQPNGTCPPLAYEQNVIAFTVSLVFWIACFYGQAAVTVCRLHFVDYECRSIGPCSREPS